MTEIEKKALELVNEIHSERNGYAFDGPFDRKKHSYDEALCRLLEQHEAFRQEVSDAVEDYVGYVPPDNPAHPITRFIITKPDPLVEAVKDILDDDSLHNADEFSEAIRAALAKRGGRIVFDD